MKHRIMVFNGLWVDVDKFDMVVLNQEVIKTWYGFRIKTRLSIYENNIDLPIYSLLYNSNKEALKIS